MNFKNFVEEIKLMLKESLGDSFTVEEKTVLKNNGVKLTGIVIMEGEQNCVPNIYLNAYYDQFKDGRCMRDIVYEIVKYYEHLPKPVLIAIQEYLNDELYYRNPEKEKRLPVVEPTNTQENVAATNEADAKATATVSE